MTQQQIDALSVDQLWDAVCLATKECECDCHIDPVQVGRGCCEELHIPPSDRAWALPGMQEKCAYPASWSDARSIRTDPTHSQCPRCHGTGYVAKRDLGALLECLPAGWHLTKIAFDTTKFWAVDNPYHQVRVSYCENVTRAGLEAVAQALVAQGATLGAT